MVLYCCSQWTLCSRCRLIAGCVMLHRDLWNSDTCVNECISFIVNIVKVNNPRHLRFFSGHVCFLILISVSVNCWYITGLHVLDSSSVTVSLFHGVIAKPLLQQVYVWLLPLKCLNSAEAFRWLTFVFIFCMWKKKKCALVSAPGRDANFYAALLQSDIATMR